MSAARATAGLLLCALALSGPLAAGADEKETLPVLRRRLLEANTPERLEHALDRLAARIGEPGWFADAEAFARWLAELPDGRAADPRVRRRQGWALVGAGRGAEAVAPLEAARADDPSDGHTRYWLGEALRQAGRFAEACEQLTAAARCGLREPALAESMLAAVTALAKGRAPAAGASLPAYVAASGPFLLAWPEPRLHLTLARWLLEDARVAGAGGPGPAAWRAAAAEHGLGGLTGMAARFEGDAAFALALGEAVLDREAQAPGETPCFDLLALAYRLGHDPARDRHTLPRALTLLAEAAAREGRFALAARLVDERLAISDSPRARRLLRTLPPDQG